MGAVDYEIGRTVPGFDTDLGYGRTESLAGRQAAIGLHGERNRHRDIRRLRRPGTRHAARLIWTISPIC